MATLKEKIIEILQIEDGFTDREITDKLLGHGNPQQSINIACRDLATKNIIKRTYRSDGLIGNYLIDTKNIPLSTHINFEQILNESKLNDDVIISSKAVNELTEDEIKVIINKHLINEGWKTQLAMGKIHGIDIDAYKGKERWIIEVKGCGSRNAMRVNYFLAILGETLQRMSDPNAKYSIALPDMNQYRKLWGRLPRLAKERTGISAIFVNENFEIEEVR